MSRTARAYAATEPDLRRAMANIEADALQLGGARPTALTLVLLLEELYTNTLRHGAPPARGEPHLPAVWVELTRTANGFVLDYQDDGAAHDPFAVLDHAHLDAPVEDRPVGRLGVLLLQRLSRHSHYARHDGRNRVTLHVEDDGPHAHAS